jgi:hypothetical protein
MRDRRLIKKADVLTRPAFFTQRLFATSLCHGELTKTTPNDARRKAGCGESVAPSQSLRRPTLPTDELHDIGKPSRQGFSVKMLSDIAPATRPKFLAQCRVAIQSEHLENQGVGAFWFNANAATG